MSRWPLVKAKRLLAALVRIGWTLAWQSEYRRLTRPGEEVGPEFLAQIANKTGLRPEDLWPIVV
jgi:predicted RNA binding protein YcfA (HicA-like mRNA interferase family)